MESKQKQNEHGKLTKTERKRKLTWKQKEHGTKHQHGSEKKNLLRKPNERNTKTKTEQHRNKNTNGNGTERETERKRKRNANTCQRDPN